MVTIAPDANSVRIPVQRNGYRYIAARQAATSRPSEGCLIYEEEHYLDRVGLSPHDRCREVHLDYLESRRVAWGGKHGYRSILATHGADRPGRYYFEVELGAEEGAVDPHLRVGLARLGVSLAAPIGYDDLSYGVTDTGFIIHSMTKEPHRLGPAKLGDRIGCSLSIEPTNYFPPERPKCNVVDFFRMYFEHKISPSMHESFMPAEIQFYVNGEPVTEQPAYTKLPFGIYFPMLSIYRNAKATFLPDGEGMKFKPMDCQAWSELYSVYTEVCKVPTPSSPEAVGPESTQQTELEPMDMAPEPLEQEYIPAPTSHAEWHPIPFANAAFPKMEVFHAELQIVNNMN